MKMITLMMLLWCAPVANGFADVAPGPVPAANVNGITVGGGWVEATNRQVVRTAGNVVYIVVSDDNPCNATRSTAGGVIRVYKGAGAQAGNANVPTAFSEIDVADHPVSAGSGSCIFSGGTGNLLFAPDVRLDTRGIIHIAYIDPNATNNGKVYYQTFDTNADLWGTRVQVATNAQTNFGGGWPRGSHAVLTLDASGTPYIVFASGGTSNSIRWVAKTVAGGTAWTSAAMITGSTGTNQFQPSVVTALDGSIHLAWCDNCLAIHPNIKYAKFSSGAWGAVETVSSGDANVLGDGDHDQIPAIVTDLSSAPYVLYLDGTVSGTDNYVRMRYRNAGGSWVDNTPSGASGASNPSGKWYCHTPQNYISSVGDVFVFLGHDVNISPGPYQYQVGGVGNNWSPVNQLDPRNQTNVTAGSPGLDGSVSIRFDPLRDNNTSTIDLIYYDENDGKVGYAHHSTVYYKAVDLYLSNTTALLVMPASLSFSAIQGGGNPAPSTVNLTNAGTGTLSFTAVSDSSWLAASPASGNTPQALNVAVNAGGLAQGNYTGHVTVSSSSVQGSPSTITVALTVTAAPTLSAVAVNPTSIVGGNSSLGTVTLSGPASTGGIVVSLTSNSPLVQVLPSVTVVANATTANFTVTSSTVTAATPVTISATYNGTTQSATQTVTPVTVTPSVLLGDQAIEPQVDSDSRGVAEAFQATANATGTIGFLTVYLDSASTATKLYVGLYADNGGHPGVLLSQGSTTQLTQGTWIAIPTTGALVTSGTKYWIAILGTTSGTLFFRDRHNSACKSETSQQSNLLALPATWITGTAYADCPVSVYGQ